MFIVGNALVSAEVLERKFVCDLARCHGACCVEGEFGAPLREDELPVIERNLEGIKPYMTAAALALLGDGGGFWERDTDGDIVTRCLGGRDCLFAIKEAGIYACSIEKAHRAGATDFKKPISCHLYPIRIAEVAGYEALNYSDWDICAPACRLGAELQAPVWKFLKEPLLRAFGEDWYAELAETAEAWEAERAADGADTLG